MRIVGVHGDVDIRRPWRRSRCRFRLWTDSDKTQPADLSGATVRAQVREDRTSSDATDFEVSVTDNVVTLHLLPKSTQDLADTNVWDCQVDWQSDEVNVQTVVAGSIVASGDVTR